MATNAERDDNWPIAKFTDRDGGIWVTTDMVRASETNGANPDDDAAFVAHAREDIPWLLAEVAQRDDALHLAQLALNAQASETAELLLERTALARRIQTLEQQVSQMEAPTSFQPLNDPDLAVEPDALDDLADYIGIGVGKAAEIEAWRKLPNRWLACIVLTRDEDGGADETAYRVFATKEEAIAGLSVVPETGGAT